jgi:hypothetical protein
MAENVTLARPYAEAAFQLAKSGNALAAWSDVLARLSAVAARPEMEECIGNPRLSPEQLAQLCLDVAASERKAGPVGRTAELRSRAGRQRPSYRHARDKRAFQRAQAWSRRRQGCRDRFGLCSSTMRR